MMKYLVKFSIYVWLSLNSAICFAAIDTLTFSNTEQERTYQQLTQQLRCPQCQNNNIADSNATIAVDMRAKVYELLQDGQSKQEIIDYMVARYGHFVTYDPPLTPATLLLWILPALLILCGLWWILRRRAPTPQSALKSSSVLDQDDQQRLQQLLNNKD